MLTVKPFKVCYCILLNQFKTNLITIFSGYILDMSYLARKPFGNNLLLFLQCVYNTMLLNIGIRYAFTKQTNTAIRLFQY